MLLTTPRKPNLAEELFSEWHAKRFDFSRYKDRYREKVLQAIKAKRKGHELPVPEEEEPPAIILMDALRRNIARTGRNGAERPRRTKSDQKHSPRHSTRHRRRA
jgi:non-homologous end joining protein Ku